MDLESVFDGPLSTGSGEKPGKGVSVSVWQAEVALRLSEWTSDITASTNLCITLTVCVTLHRLSAQGVWHSHSSAVVHCTGVCSVHVCTNNQGCCSEQVRLIWLSLCFE